MHGILLVLTQTRPITIPPGGGNKFTKISKKTGKNMKKEKQKL